MTLPLFEPLDAPAPARLPLADGASLLRGHATADPAAEAALLESLERVVAAAPLRRMTTPNGLRMSVAMSNCGPLGWVSDRAGYRYAALDPESGRPWPPLPAPFLDLARGAAAAAGFAGFAPDACLVNRYEPGTRLSLHQDRDERDHSAPIVSVSLGLPAVFLFGGLRRSDPAARVPLGHGDVVVWGGPARLRFHGVLPLKPGEHPRLGARRFNLTFRRAG
jgi:alkylated DNA repair protein (DNA oxidative demethylase)